MPLWLVPWLWRGALYLGVAIVAYLAWESLVANPYRREGAAKLQVQLDAATVANRSCSASVADLTAKIGDQNHAIEALKDDAKAREADAAKRIAEADRRANAARSAPDHQRAQAIVDGPPTAAADAGCADVASLLRDFGARRLRYFAQPGPGSADGNRPDPGIDALRIK